MSGYRKNLRDPLAVADEFRAAVEMSEWFPYQRQRDALVIGTALFVVAGVVWGGLSLTNNSLAPDWVGTVAAVSALITLLLMVVTGALHSFYRYYRLADPADNDSDAMVSSIDKLSYPAAEILLAIDDMDDVTTGFLSSRFGQQVCRRVGVNPKDLYVELKNRSGPSVQELMKAVSDEIVTLEFLTKKIIEADEGLAEALFSQGVQKETFIKSARWVQRRDRRWRKQTRPYSAENLSRITPLGQDFTYGQAYTLKRFSRPLQQQSVFLGANTSSEAFAQDIESVLNILSRPRNANALLVGSTASGIGDILATIRNRLFSNKIPPALADKKLYVLDTSAILTATEDRGDLDRLLKKILVEATTAGNILLVIEDIVSFREAASDRGVDLFGLLETFLEYSQLPIIATTNVRPYHNELEGREVMTYFGAVPVHEVEDDTLFTLLTEVADGQEGESLCTVGGIEAIARGARELIADDKMPHAAVDLLLEILSAHSGEVIDRSLVQRYLSDKTGVPTGTVTEEEKETLSDLADKLHERIVGQDKAVQAIAAALRRNRAGVENQDRPIGTFLFLGPTGVGKTETAKTLARIYFESSTFQRLDMSEYSQPDAIDTLRGSANQTGRLANMVREHPYGVLLLDEFEKASSAVHDLFLQILDEGHFTDGQGRRVSLDNMIIIATSNAGAQKIFSLVDNGIAIEDKEDEIIDDLIAQGTFRPELINRFDAAVLYHPLSTEDLQTVTDILLDELKGRIKEQGFRLKLDSGVTDYIVENGYNPEFGARAIRRVIQDTVENAVADKIIDEGYSAGDEINLTVSDLKAADTQNN